MIAVDVDAILLDIEGTTSSIEFVYQTMFPFVRRELDGFLFSRFDDPEVAAVIRQIGEEAGWGLLPDAFEHEALRAATLSRIRDEVLRWMDADAKTSGLKQLQGLIWRSGFESGELVSHVFPDVPEALENWTTRGIDIRVYSSGSIEAQQLFFGHTEFGELLRFFSGFYDTTIGPKRKRSSYHRIAVGWSRNADRILFISDVTEELAAAADAGMQVALAIRSGNHPQSDAARWPQIRSFRDIDIRVPV